MKAMVAVGLVSLLALGGVAGLSGIGADLRSDDGLFECENVGNDAFEKRFERATPDGRERVDLKAETAGELEFEVEHEAVRDWSFKVEVCDLVEFEDLDGDGIFDRSDDRLIAALDLPEFGPVGYAVVGDEHVLTAVSVDGRMQIEFRVTGSFANGAADNWQPTLAVWSLTWDYACRGTGFFGLEVDQRERLNDAEDRVEAFHAAECGSVLAASGSA